MGNIFTQCLRESQSEKNTKKRQSLSEQLRPVSIVQPKYSRVGSKKRQKQVGETRAIICACTTLVARVWPSRVLAIIAGMVCTWENTAVKYEPPPPAESYFETTVFSTSKIVFTALF